MFKGVRKGQGKTISHFKMSKVSVHKKIELSINSNHFSFGFISKELEHRKNLRVKDYSY